MTLSSPIHTTCTNNTTTNDLDQPRSAEISSMSQTTSEIIPGSWRNDSKNSSHFFCVIRFSCGMVKSHWHANLNDLEGIYGCTMSTTLLVKNFRTPQFLQFFIESYAV